MGEFSKHFMSKPYTTQVYHYILACVGAENDIPVTDITSALTAYSSTDSGASLSAAEDKPTLLHSLICLISPHIGE